MQSKQASRAAGMQSSRHAEQQACRASRVETWSRGRCGESHEVRQGHGDVDGGCCQRHGTRNECPAAVGVCVGQAKEAAQSQLPRGSKLAVRSVGLEAHDSPMGGLVLEGWSCLSCRG